MKINVALLMVIVLILMIIGPAASGGSTGSGTGVFHGFVPGIDMAGSLPLLQTGTHGGNWSLYDLSAGNAIFGLYASSESLAGASPYIPRARSLIDQNENRNRILQYVTESPGAIQNDMVRSLDINIGTLRYHLMILGLNHRVVAYQDGARLVRYFANNGAYSREQMEIISLLKRIPTGKLLSAMAGKTGMTCAAISAVSGLPYCEVNKYMKELVAKGVVQKEPVGASRYQYRVAPGMEAYVARMFRP